ncbi:sulfate adenylyltransferase [Arthrobacter sp. JZ12]|uniref:sulfate adenylyltransferase subunit 1 n=1 Tax=Arthrobacter sp. JZ12 TaxID=2654190 RepID=UPI002B4742E4|nr:GTP-binding protein [Arthrobacter sp. JZ12]WRH25694.1 sulfate adenylyltransferase [Arthrobacter sp. JZ12]
MSPAVGTALEHSTLFRFATAGSVDDGKSTLVGRLLHDSKSVLADQLDAVARTSAERGFGGERGGLDLALLTDGLRAEREQGITIDVAYRYFATANRTFILADTPGHVQYTKNTVTGASTADAVVVLIDARKGVLEQTRRHLAVARLLRVAHIIVAVNKIDLVNYSEDVFRDVEAQLTQAARDLRVDAPAVIPVSALEGDNVVDRSDKTPWYSGPSLLELLEQLPALADLETDIEAFRFPVQTVIRPQGAVAPGLDADTYRDYRGYAGQVAAGSIRVGDAVTVQPSGRVTTVTGIDFAGQELLEAFAPQSVVLRLADDIDIARGDLLAEAGTGASLPQPTQDLYAALCWLSPKPLKEGSRLLIKHGSKTVQGLVRQVINKLDLSTFADQPASGLELNDIGTVHIRLAAPLPVDNYVNFRRTGAFLVIDPSDGNTLAAGLVETDHLELSAREDERYDI